LKFSFYSQISRQIIASNCSYKLTLNRINQIIIIEAINDINIRYQDNLYQLNKTNIIITKDCQIVNMSNETKRLRAIIINIENNDFIFPKNPIILTDNNTGKYILLRDIIRHSTSSDHNISAIEKLFETFFQKYLSEDQIIKEQKEKILKGKIDPRLLLVNRYIRNNYHNQITLQILADLIGCNAVYLSNTYTKVLKISPMKYLQLFRMMKAKQLITNTNLSISKIAEKLGYVSSSQFGTIFKKNYGITACEHRINNKLDCCKNYAVDLNQIE
jgi:YesN/AraC family two-component response regulator